MKKQLFPNQLNHKKYQQIHLSSDEQVTIFLKQTFKCSSPQTMFLYFINLYISSNSGLKYYKTININPVHDSFYNLITLLFSNAYPTIHIDYSKDHCDTTQFYQYLDCKRYCFLFLF